jgi:hypothetical protein
MTTPRLRILISLIAFAPAPFLLSAQTAANKSAEQMKALFESHKADFDYLLGDWEFTTVSKQYGQGRGYWSAVRLITGHILDEFRIVGDKDETYYVTTTVRAYNAALERWELIGMEGSGGLQDFGTGQRKGSEFHIEQKFGVATGKPSTLRIRYYDIQPDRFSWNADRSNDGGKTWIKNDQHIEAHRIGPPRSLGALSAFQKATGK